MKSRTLALWTAALLAAAGAFIAHLTLRFENVRLGYEIGEARREERELAAAKRLLALEAATLTQPDRVEVVARRNFRMDVADAARVATIGAGSVSSARAPASGPVSAPVSEPAARRPP